VLHHGEHAHRFAVQVDGEHEVGTLAVQTQSGDAFAGGRERGPVDRRRDAGRQ